MKRFVLGISAFCCIFSAAYASEEVKLPKVRIAGQEYYVYEIKKGILFMASPTVTAGISTD